MKDDRFELIGNTLDEEQDWVSRGGSYWQDVWGRFRANRGAVIGFFIIVIILIMAVVGIHLDGHSFDEQIIQNQNLAPRVQGLEKLGILDGSETMKSPSGARTVVNGYVSEEKETGLEDTYYWFGTDVLGRDIFTRTWMGTRISLYIALVAVLIDIVFGLTYGVISGYFGGAVDMVMQRIVEILHGIPSLVIMTLLIFVLSPGLSTITIALIITGWTGMSRIARAEVLRLREQEFVLASKTLGAGSFFIIFREILPNIVGPIITNTMFSIPDAIFTEAFLAYIGLGVAPPMASLGTLISDAYKSFTIHPYMILPPVIVLALLMLGFNLFADGLRDAFDPRMKEI